MWRIGRGKLKNYVLTGLSIYATIWEIKKIKAMKRRVHYGGCYREPLTAEKRCKNRNGKKTWSRVPTGIFPEAAMGAPITAPEYQQQPERACRPYLQRSLLRNRDETGWYHEAAALVLDKSRKGAFFIGKIQSR